MDGPAIRSRSTLGAAALLAALAAPGAAATRFYADLTGADAVPPTGSQAIGTADFTLDDSGTVVEFVIAFRGLEGVETHTHIHQGRPGADGPVLLTLPPGTPKTGVWHPTPADVAALFDGRIYVVVHTDPFVTGEIRGHLHEVAIAVDGCTWGAVKALFR